MNKLIYDAVHRYKILNGLKIEYNKSYGINDFGLRKEVIHNLKNSRDTDQLNDMGLGEN